MDCAENSINSITSILQRNCYEFEKIHLHKLQSQELFIQYFYTPCDPSDHVTSLHRTTINHNIPLLKLFGTGINNSTVDGSSIQQFLHNIILMPNRNRSNPSRATRSRGGITIGWVGFQVSI